MAFSMLRMFFAICIRDTIPSCILAPPEHVKMMIGNLICVARSNCSCDLLTNNFSHASHHEICSHDCDHNIFSKNLSFSCDDRFIKIRYGALAFQFYSYILGSSVDRLYPSLHPILQKVSLSNTMQFLSLDGF